MSKGMSGHQSANMITDVWLTPPEILQSLGVFDLDPCAPLNRPWDTALNHYTILDNGLIKPWFGRVWLNPPYGREMEKWMQKMAQHQHGGISLIFARTETKAFHRHIFPVADSILFIENRLHFYTAEGMRAKFNSGAPSVLIAYGEENVEALDRCGIKGKHLFLNTVPFIVVTAPETWKEAVAICFARANSPLSLERLYNIIEELAPGKVSKNPHYKAKIRQVVQQHFTRTGKGIYTA